jgi:phosphoribosylglycinamide formyltransferase-1
MRQLILFASGRGSNVEAIIDFFKEKELVKIVLIVCNNPQAGVLDIARNHDVPVLLVNKKDFLSPDFLKKLKACNPSLIALAGFLWKIPEEVVHAFPGKIINIHPALLPKYGGKGMYGAHVHEAVKAAGERETGITIHLIDEHYDKGNVILQAFCPVCAADTPEKIAENVHRLEHYYFPRAIEFLLGEKEHFKNSERI